MKPTAAPRRASTLPPPVLERVRQAASSLGISVEIWEGTSRTPERLALGEACAACEEREPRLFDRCRKRRTYLARRDSAVGLELSERCPLRLRLSRLGPQDGEAGPTFFGFGYGTTSASEEDPAVLAFLRDLRHLVERAHEEVATERRATETPSSPVGPFEREEIDRSTLVRTLDAWRELGRAERAFLWSRAGFVLSGVEAIDGPWEQLARRLQDALARTGHDFHVERLSPQHPIARSLGGDCDCIAVPLVVDGHRHGVLGALRRTGDDFEPAEIRTLCAFAAPLALVVAQATRWEERRDMLVGTVRALVAAVDAAVGPRAGYSERVHLVAMLLGEQLGLDAETLETVHWASLLHGVGKLGQEAGEAVLHQLERWDGTGTPSGLAGDAVPLAARVVGVAAAFALFLATDHDARAVRRALGSIAREAGSRFDPVVVAALVRLGPALEAHPLFCEPDGRPACR